MVRFRRAVGALCLSLASAGLHAQTEVPAMKQCQLERSVARHAEFEIELPRAGTTGYEWFVELPDGEGGPRLLSQGLRTEPPVPGRVGEPVRQWWRFKAGADDAELNFYLHPSWSGKGDASEQCRVEIHVH